MRKWTRLVTLFLMVALAPAAKTVAQSGEWEFLSTTDIGAEAFLKAHPAWDGRGVLIAVCDSGVDLGLPGLLKTSEGKPKIVDARVFCDEGKIDLKKAILSTDEHGKAYHAKGGKWLYGAEGKLPADIEKGSGLYVGYFKESDFVNSDARGGDLNGNGRTDDVYGLLVYKTGEGKEARWMSLLDTNGDGDLSDEKAVGDFSKTRESFELRGRDLHADSAVMTFALNLWPGEEKAALYMADGAHGTHVSGIAAGYRIDGQEGFNGIAPGAQILALKIGDNTLSGGATTAGSMVAAWRYAVKRAEELDMPLVIQMSYGIGSENEGRAVAERLIDALLDEHPGVVATVSAGNEGPGLSTVGLPACAGGVLSVAAILPRTSARDLYGVALFQDELFSFSSRGGDAAKPNVAAPGVAASTVPTYEDGRNVFRGTSMASPQAAGACALLLSAAKASGLNPRRDQVMAAVERGAVSMAGYGPLDVGRGRINVPRSWTVLQALARRPAWEPARYSVTTLSAEMAGGRGPSVFWRGSFYPKGGRQQVVTVKPLFPEEASGSDKAGFYAAFDLASTAPWFHVDKGSVFMKAKQAAKVPITFDEARLRKPGLYQGSILAYAKGSSAADRRRLGPEWTVPVAVVVPAGLGFGNAFTYKKRFEGLKPAKVTRRYFRLSSDVAGFRVGLEAPANQRDVLVAYLFDPEGREAGVGVLRAGKAKTSLTVAPERLAPGVWEVDLYPYYSNIGPVSATLTAEALPLARSLPRRVTVRTPQGGTPGGKIRVTSTLPRTLRAEVSGKVVGWVTEKTVKAEGGEWSKTFRVAPGEKGVRFFLSMSPEDFNLFTDVAVQVLDSEGKALTSSGMNYRMLEISMKPPAGSSSDTAYTLKIIAAVADPDASPGWKVALKETHAYVQPVPVKGKAGKEEVVTLYPDHEARLTLTLATVPPALPSGAAWLADVTLRDVERSSLSFPLEIELETAE